MIFDADLSTLLGGWGRIEVPPCIITALHCSSKDFASQIQTGRRVAISKNIQRPGSRDGNPPGIRPSTS